jgi:signal transduction histidine kinase
MIEQCAVKIRNDEPHTIFIVGQIPSSSPATRAGWPLLAFAFGALLTLLVIAAWMIERKSNAIYEEMRRIQSEHQRREAPLRKLRSDASTLAILIRDYLLDPTYFSAEQQGTQLLEVHASMRESLKLVERDLGPEDKQTVLALRREVEDYGESVQQVLRWTPAERLRYGTTFLRRRVIPFRETILSIARQIEELNTSNLRLQQEAIRGTQREFEGFLQLMFGLTLFSGVLIAGTSITRMARLEKRAELLRLQTEQHRQELRNLSQQLVKAQEEERRAISRELHDQIGQMLTAIQMEFGNLGTLRNETNQEFEDHLTEGKALAERTLRAVRDMAMGLRPSMLDDLGLAPALDWQAREFTRRSGIPVDLELEGELNNLPDRVRTCVYRVVQEALTNCARHANPSNVRVTVHRQQDLISLIIQDDGTGLPADGGYRRGVGLIGMEERVRELGGEIQIISQPNRGTLVRVTIPSSAEASA